VGEVLGLPEAADGGEDGLGDVGTPVVADPEAPGVEVAAGVAVGVAAGASVGDDLVVARGVPPGVDLGEGMAVGWRSVAVGSGPGTLGVG
jgi:hypothetical protein